ncbi:MAG: DNA polymerase III subunit delta [Patescibacteria group bacterium]
MIILLHGDDSYRSLQRLKVLKEGFIQKFDKSGLNVVTIDKDNVSFEDFQKAVAAAGFLSQKRLVLLKGLMSNKVGKETLQQMADYIIPKNLTADNIIIFWEPKQIKSGALFNKLKKAADKTEKFDPLDNLELTKWVKKEIKDRKGQIDLPGLRLLIEMVGNNLWQLNNEIDKLVSYKSGKEIKKEDVELFVRAKFDEDVFHLTDALGAKNVKTATELIDDQLRSGNHPLALLATLAWQFRNLIQIQERIESGTSSYSVASELGIHPFVVKKSQVQLRKFDLAQLKLAYQQLLEIDIKMKTSRVDPKTLLNLFVLQVCS